MKKNIDMCNGPLTGNILLFAVQIMMSALIQLLFNTADTIIVGRFAGNQALAAVGSTTALINLLVGLFMGISVGANILIAQYLGAEEKENANTAAHTAILSSMVGGILLMLIGIGFARPMLELMGNPDDVIEMAALYVKIYFVGVPFNLLYNFGSAVLKASGNARQPLLYLSVSGVLNVCLNLIFVIVFRLSVAGVAWATVFSQILAAALTLRYLCGIEGPAKIELQKLRINPSMLKKILSLGLPAGIQGSLVSIANIVMQSHVNRFGSLVLAGNSAASNIEMFLFTSGNALYQTTINFVSQNRGAKKYDRTIRAFGICAVIGVAFMGAASVLLLTCGEHLLGIYTSDPQLIEYGMIRFTCIGGFYVLDVLFHVTTGYVRGMGYSFLPTAIVVGGMCVLRIAYLQFSFRRFGTLQSVYYSYPVTWTAVILANSIVIIHIVKKIRNNEFKISK